MSDLDHSIVRAWKKDDRAAKAGGYGATSPGRAVIHRLLQPLIELIIVERRDEQHPAYKAMKPRVDRRRVDHGLGGEQRRRSQVLEAIDHIDHINVASRILHVAVSLVYDPMLGRSKKKKTRNPARIIGQNLDQDDGAMAFRVGCWAIELLKEIGFEDRGGDLQLPLTVGVGLD